VLSSSAAAARITIRLAFSLPAVHLSTPLLLDLYGDAPVPSGYKLVDNELDWLRETANAGTSAPRVVLRGHALIHWARTWWETQGGSCDELTSPGYTLHRLVPSLPLLAAQAIAQELNVHWGESQWPVPLSVPVVLTALYPAAQTLWELSPIAESGAIAQAAGQWLSWHYDANIQQWSAVHQPLLAAWVAEWEHEAPQAEIMLPLDPVVARAVHLAWVGLPDTQVSRSVRQVLNWVGPCPNPVPSTWLANAREQWEGTLSHYVTNRPAGTEASTAVVAWWGQVDGQGLHPDLLPIALSVVLQFVYQYPATLTSDLLRSLRGSMAPDEYTQLARRLPPAEPGQLPQEPEAVLRWTVDEYLPYRTWQANQEQPDEATTAIVRRHALAFGEWLLVTYPSRLSGATHPYQHLYWSQPGRVLPQKPNEVVLWVIADGLGWADARHIAQQVREKSAGLIATTAAIPCFGLLPSITHFTKVPVRAGIPYHRTLSRRAELKIEADSDVRGNQDPVSRLGQLTGGQMLVWKPLEPDSTYHERAEASVVRRNALGKLNILAETIVAAAQGVPRSLDLRILLTTDHGRMLGTGQRAVTVPEGFKAHGRAAYREAFGPRPKTSDDIDWLDPEYFNLPGWVGIVRDERSFRICQPDGSQAGGADNFSHGGIWPEEVVVPWLMLQRSATPIKITGTAGGRARVGATGTVMLRLTNAADRSVRLLRFTLRRPNGIPLEVDANAELPSLQNSSVTVLLNNWLDGQSIAVSELSITVELPDGSEQQFPLSNQLGTDEFQTRQVDLLGDL
jgi:hypothetical protein